MNRRHLLCCSAALVTGLFTGLAAAGNDGPRGGWRNPCRGALPPRLAQHDLVLSAWEGLDPAQVWDAHAHLLGTGDSGSGCRVHAHMHQWWHPGEVLRRHAILNAACVPGDAASIDRAYVERLARLAQAFPAGVQWCLFAFDHACDEAGREHEDWTTFHVPNGYAARIATDHPQRMRWVASVHPYRADAVQRLQDAIERGAVAVKWLPSAMNIDLRHPRCRPVYELLARHAVPLIVHCGEEKAVPGAARDDFGNPLLVRAPLEAGVRVIVAHAASLGHARDLDKRSQPKRSAFELWARLMDEPAWRERLLADVSAVFQRNRRPEVWRTLLVRDDWHPRLLHGSDYPLPGVMPLYSAERLAGAGLLDHQAVPVLDAIREHNPLLFDFVLKRHLRAGSAKLQDCVFETRRHLQPRPQA